MPSLYLWRAGVYPIVKSADQSIAGNAGWDVGLPAATLGRDPLAFNHPGIWSARQDQQITATSRCSTQ